METSCLHLPSMLIEAEADNGCSPGSRPFESRIGGDGMAEAAAAKLAALQDSTGWEWGIFIYRGADGQIHASDAFTAEHPDSITGASVLPDGAHIVGYIHTHPVDPDSDQRNLSPAERDFIRELIDMTGPVTADDKLLSGMVMM